MSFAKMLFIGGCLLFGAIGVAWLVKQKPAESSSDSAHIASIELGEIGTPQGVDTLMVEERYSRLIPEADLMGQFFNTGLPKLPIVETISYSSRVDWNNGKPAWVADYASHYKTSRHFIARSLNQERDYQKQKVSNGDRFNVLKPDLALEFYLVVDLNRCRMWVYYYDVDKAQRVLVKTYPVGIGRPDPAKASGWLTPLGKYTLGEKIAVYRPGTMGLYNNEKSEMVRIFGTRWIPFEEEVRGCTMPARGFGVHGCPYHETETELVEDTSGLGGHTSDGCIRLATDDMEELFSIIITRPTTIELVNDFFDATPPGEEVSLEEYSAK